MHSQTTPDQLLNRVLQTLEARKTFLSASLRSRSPVIIAVEFDSAESAEAYTLELQSIGAQAQIDDNNAAVVLLAR